MLRDSDFKAERLQKKEQCPWKCVCERSESVKWSSNLCSVEFYLIKRLNEEGISDLHQFTSSHIFRQSLARLQPHLFLPSPSTWLLHAPGLRAATVDRLLHGAKKLRVERNCTFSG